MKIRDDLKSNYGTYYAGGDSEWRRVCAMSKVDNIVSLCRRLPRRSIIEIGAGEGSVLRRLSELFFGDELYAVEISPSGVETIESKRIPRLVECKLFDGCHIPYENDKFDIAVLSHVIEHVEHPRQLLYEASRVAKYLFIEVPLEDTKRKAKHFLFDRVGHINFYSPRTIRWLIQSSNLHVLSQITINPAKEACAFQYGRRGLVNYYVKQTLLNVLPELATKIFTYHAALVCKRNAS
ncbi:MAG: class I SAM-dependent methyltransferase [Anaerolineaceae bacterium]